MNQLSRGARLALSATTVVVAACGFFNPLDQPGLGLVLLPGDTALHIGASFQARGLMTNSYGDLYPSEHVTYAGLDPSISVGAGGTATALIYGRGRVTARRAGFADTAWVSVVPPGTLALSLAADPSAVVLVDTDGSGFVALVSAGQSGGGSPAWLPGNAGLVYHYAIPGGAGATRLYVTTMAGNATLLDNSGRDPRVSRDGNWVYFGDQGVIWRIHVNGTGKELVSSGGVYNPDPSPDSTQLVFMSTGFPGGGFKVGIRDLIGGTEVELTPGAMPRWAPSGDSIAYWWGDPSTEAGAIYIMAADGTGSRQVSLPGRVYTPQGIDWSPDGQWLVARSATLDIIQVATGLTLPLGYGSGYYRASWRW